MNDETSDEVSTAASNRSRSFDAPKKSAMSAATALGLLALRARLRGAAS